MKFEITNLETGKKRQVNIDFEKMGKASVKSRHKGKSKKEISEYYRNIQRGNKDLTHFKNEKKDD